MTNTTNTAPETPYQTITRRMLAGEAPAAIAEILDLEVAA